jgi:hypothetical protein
MLLFSGDASFLDTPDVRTVTPDRLHQGHPIEHSLLWFDVRLRGTTRINGIIVWHTVFEGEIVSWLGKTRIGPVDHHYGGKPYRLRLGLG